MLRRWIQSHFVARTLTETPRDQADRETQRVELQNNKIIIKLLRLAAMSAGWPGV